MSHDLGERALLNVVGDNSLVILRPGYFMSNIFIGEVSSVKNLSKLFGCHPPSYHLPMTDPRDISDVALNVMLDPIEKHGVAVYGITPDPLSYEERAEIYSRVLGKKVEYVRDTYENVYNAMSSHGLPHSMVYDLINLGNFDFSRSTPQVTILTKKPRRTFEQFLIDNKEKFL